ncbi:xanthine dehydrogenase family protein molybdopterin-binding subunit [Herbaspirillum frisingense]|uniref:xanthine dehydrogenase family protein molybdopterin-binding subunit n=1 Tax=Herbaspirillum frisingense TaxID=92645 RepID=UPI001601B7EC|nr:xanthine dehydrogenase family protein molybdopterin-binding subunit [Herbaspirillum frisingense]QNB06724.1 xanthine dehydrogenase family protein molybdopterin-binding subunit [Herbaspirillum frisingense]
MSIRHFVTSEKEVVSDSRRNFLKSSGALVVGFWALPDTVLAAPAKETSPNAYVASAFVTIGSDESIVFTMAKVEMGQGAYTVLPMLIAEELEVDLDKVTLRHAPPDAKVYGLPFGDQFTGGSLSVRTLWEPMRQTGAAARLVLIQAAADGWKVPVADCHAEHGAVVHRPTGRRISYGKLATSASRYPVPDKIVLKPADQFKLVGTSAKRLDTRDKSNGRARFGIDVSMPNMLHASVMASPVFGGKLRSVDDSKTRALPGIRQIVKIDNAVAVVATNTWYARQGLAALQVEWDEGANAKLTTADIRQLMVNSLDKPGVVARSDGDAPGLISQNAQRLEHVYVSPMLAHAPMEPLNATVHVRGDSAEIWAGTQAPARARDGAAAVLGLPPEKVELHNFLIGGGFGRRLEVDYVEQAAAIAKQVEGPVKVTWTREEDIRHDVFRGLYAHRVSAVVDEQGYPKALYHKFAGPSNLRRWAPGWMTKEGVDIDAVDGSVNFPYAIPNMRTEFTIEDGPVPTGFWRGVGPTRNVPTLESFIDELAYRAGRDPLAYRLAMLDKHPRARAVLERAATMSGWGAKLPAGKGRGIGLLYAWDTYVAQVVDLEVNEKNEIKVNRVVCVTDCGVAVNPDTVIAQMQGGINFALTAGLYSNITIKDGRAEQSNFHDYPMLRMSEAPRIEVELINSGAAPGGIGEPSVASFLAAFLNAIHAATGKRLYELPATPDMLAASPQVTKVTQAVGQGDQRQVRYG